VNIKNITLWLPLSARYCTAPIGLSVVLIKALAEHSIQGGASINSTKVRGHQNKGPLGQAEMCEKAQCTRSTWVFWAHFQRRHRGL